MASVRNPSGAAHGRYDEVFLNETLPGTAGTALATELRALHTDLPILIATDAEIDQLLQRFANDRLFFS
jgi:DNA-binding response OmpR family regulator